MGVGFQEVAKSKWRPLCGQKYECADMVLCGMVCFFVLLRGIVCYIAWYCVVWFWGQKYECADLLTIPVTLTTRNAATASIQIQQQIQIQESTNRITEQIFER